ncbi:hypothetical protein TNCV_3642581 [Trichonephila clavipes]|nr:hypothetical protein TNCV_3642581 [Trichonephila clavipes]
MDLVVLNQGQVTRTVLELAPPVLTTTPTGELWKNWLRHQQWTNFKGVGLKRRSTAIEKRPKITIALVQNSLKSRTNG